MEPTEPSKTSQLDELISKYSPYLHEIKKRALFTLLFFTVSTVVGFVFYEKIIKFVVELLSLKGVNIVFTSPFQFINLAISCGIAAGLVLTFPLSIYQTLSFLKPALKDTEFKKLVVFLPFSIILFLIGFSFGVSIMKWQIEIFLKTSQSIGIGNILDISHLISTVLMVSALMGLAFQLPIILIFLMRLKIITHSYLSKKRLWVYLGSLIFALLLPADSILIDILLALPLLALFELTLIIDRLLQRRVPLS